MRREGGAATVEQFGCSLESLGDAPCDLASPPQDASFEKLDTDIQEIHSQMHGSIL